MRTRHRTRGAHRRLVAVVAAHLGIALVAAVPGVEAAMPSRAPTQRISTAAPTVLPDAALGKLPRYGQRGAHVMRAQQALIAAGIPVAGGADGIFGVKTTAAVRTFQRTRGLDVTGTIDTATARALGLALPVQGDRGSDVKRLQKALIAAGFTPVGGADGVFGSGTAHMITLFQEANGLPETGVVDAATAVALKFAPQPRAASDVTTSTSTTTAPTTTVKPTTTTVKPTTTTVKPTTTTVKPTTTTVKPTTTTTATNTTTPTNTGNTGNGNGSLKVGSRGPAVVRLQQALLGLSIPVAGGADGVFGNATRTAVVTFQTKASLSATGVVDAASRRRLDLVLPKVGDRTNAVKRLQQTLLDKGITVRGGADGIFGSATSAAVMTFQERNGLSSTGTVDELTAVRLDFRPAPAGLPGMPTTTTSSTTSTTAPATSVKIKVFPVQGLCWFADTWMAPRGGGRRHEGVDIIAAEGKRIYAVTDGTITRQYFDQPGSLSGNGIRLTRDDGTYFFYAHFSRFADGIGIGVPVKAGQLVGYVGSTGNSSTPHLHFEVHPGGGAAVNPTPVVRAVDACKNTSPRR